MSRSKVAYAFFGVIFFTLVFLLLRENEGRTAAEEKLRDMQFTLDSLKNDKASAVTGFEADILELQRKLQDAAVRYEVLANEKAALIEGLRVEKEETAKEHQAALAEKGAEIGNLESKMTEDSLKFEDALKEKNTELNELGTQLESTSAQLASALKKKEALENDKISLEKRVAALEAEVRTLTRQKTRLAELVKSAQSQKAPAD